MCETSSVSLIFIHGTHRNVKNRWVRSSLKSDINNNFFLGRDLTDCISLKVNSCIISTFFSCFFRNWIQCSACYQVYNSHRLIFFRCTYYSRKDRKHMFATISLKSILQLSRCRLHKSFVRDCDQQKVRITMWKNRHFIAPIIFTESLVHGLLLKTSSVIKSVLFCHSHSVVKVGMSSTFPTVPIKVVRNQKIENFNFW